MKVNLKGHQICPWPRGKTAHNLFHIYMYLLLKFSSEGDCNTTKTVHVSQKQTVILSYDIYLL